MQRSIVAWKTAVAGALVLFVSCAADALGQTSDRELLGRARSALGQLPASMPSAGNPITPAKVALGRALFWETRLSVDGTVSCARCHLPGLYATDGLPKSVGNNGKLNPRNAPTVLNAAGQISQHWIGNRTSVEDQAKQALIGPPSFGLPSYEVAVATLLAIPGYAPLFAAAFPGQDHPVSAETFALAVGAFERTLVTPAAFDAFLDGDEGALSPSAKRGLDTFMTEGCSECHAGPYVGGQMYQKFGVLAPYAKHTASSDVDAGRFAVTQQEADRFVFKVPVLRNVAMTPPYFHDGSVSLLTHAVRIMAKIQLGNELSGERLDDIVAFLASLTGRVPADLLTAPTLPSKQGFGVAH
jgi:cytochrome c peroxidase